LYEEGKIKRKALYSQRREKERNFSDRFLILDGEELRFSTKSLSTPGLEVVSSLPQARGEKEKNRGIAWPGKQGRRDPVGGKTSRGGEGGEGVGRRRKERGTSGKELISSPEKKKDAHEESRKV